MTQARRNCFLSFGKVCWRWLWRNKLIWVKRPSLWLLPRQLRFIRIRNIFALNSGYGNFTEHQDLLFLTPGLNSGCKNLLEQRYSGWPALHSLVKIRNVGAWSIVGAISGPKNDKAQRTVEDAAQTQILRHREQRHLLKNFPAAARGSRKEHKHDVTCFRVWFLASSNESVFKKLAAAAFREVVLRGETFWGLRSSTISFSLLYRFWAFRLKKRKRKKIVTKLDFK